MLYYRVSLRFELIVCHYVLSSLWGWCLLRFPQKLMFDSSLPPVLCRRSHGLCTLFVFVCVLWVRHISCCIFGLFFNWITPLSPKLLIRITVATIEIWLFCRALFLTKGHQVWLWNVCNSATELISLLSFISVVFVRYNIREGIFGTVEIRIDEFYS